MGKQTKGSVIYLHGDLDLRIIEARRLPNMDLVSSQMRRCFSSCDFSHTPTSTSMSDKKTSKRLQHHGHIVNGDAYVTVCLGMARVARTRVISNSHCPFWNERFKIPLAHPVSKIEFHIKDNDVFGADLIGIASVPASKVHSGEPICDWFPIISSYGKPPKSNCAIRVELKFSKCDDNPLFKQGMSGNYGISNCYFPMRQGCALTLYQDAHVTEAKAPEIELEDGKFFKHGKCWEDMCHAILEAHHLVYIVGWSIYHKIRLVREPSRPLPAGGNLTLGDLLRYKSQEGVRVLLLVWDDKTSHNKFFFKTNGVMQTHDEETRKFFKHSSVSCVLSPRYASSKLSIFKQQVVGTLFTHHQKCVLVDTQASGNNRKISAFIGGLDLCDGRYDTPEHRLLQDLDTVFRDDVHNPSLPAGTKGPREPWHDLHCKIEGPAAYDVLTNFEQRWKKATKSYGLKQRFKRVAHLHEDALIKLDRISWILSPSMTTPNNNPALWVSTEEDPEDWHVQIFRSIDSGSVRGFPKTVYAAESENLVWTKNLVVDKSIQRAYIQAIRSAQHFIYIENQYFIGSSYAWSSYTEAGADNLIPMELALKIVSKIRAKERFAVYVVVPMWPEGVPTSVSVQQILFWQGQTMKLMYKIIAQELKSSDIDNAQPLDYLNFYCLGNREELPAEESKEDKSVSSSGSESESETSQRFMIYVHSKGMIVDDEYVILGSANINQRSLAGTRDTEIAMGAYQPHQTWSKRKKHPRGQVYGYRMSLWAEHMGLLDDCFKEPESLTCVRIVNTIAEENWKRYAAEAYSKLEGHLLKYPIHVDINGKVSRLPGHETFPVVGGKVLGSRSTLPDALTT